MTADAPDVFKRVSDWLADLAVLAGGGRPVPELSAKLQLYMAMLLQKLPPEAFTQASLLEVAAHCGAFPAFGQLLPLLEAWWMANRPPPPVLPEPGYEDLTPREQADVRAMLRSLDRQGEAAGTMRRAATQLSLLRFQCQQAAPHSDDRASWERVALALIRRDPRYAAANEDDRYFPSSDDKAR